MKTRKIIQIKKIKLKKINETLCKLLKKTLSWKIKLLNLLD